MNDTIRFLGDKPPTILLATSNPAKERNLRRLLEELGFTFRTLREMPEQDDVEEDGESHEENARLKASTWSRLAGGLAIASDGGVTIPTLGSSWDGLRTRRATGGAASDAEHIARLLELMRGYEGEERKVLWTEGVALARNGEVLASWEAQGTQGYLALDFDPQRIDPGFWISSIWYYPQLGKRHIDLTETELAQVDTTWQELKRLVQAYFREERGLAGRR